MVLVKLVRIFRSSVQVIAGELEKINKQIKIKKKSKLIKNDWGLAVPISINLVPRARLDFNQNCYYQNC